MERRSRGAAAVDNTPPFAWDEMLDDVDAVAVDVALG